MNRHRIPLIVTGGSVVLNCVALAEPPPSIETLLRDFEANPAAHSHMPDVSWAGYRYGEEPIPQREGPVFNVRDFGARGDGTANDQPAIRKALEAVGTEGGVVYFPAGTYRIDGLLFVHTDRTVLRGESRESVELVFTQPLAKAYGRLEAEPGRQGAKERRVLDNLKTLYGDDVASDDLPGFGSRWSWKGGTIWFTPRERVTYREDPSAPLPRGRTNDPVKEDWLAGDPVASVAPARRGDTRIELDSTTGIQPGDFILLQMTDDKTSTLARHLSGDGEWADAFNRTSDLSRSWFGFRHLHWPAEVIRTEGAFVHLRQPLRFDIRREWKPVLRPIGPVISESGLERMTIRHLRQHGWETAGHNMYPGWNGVWFQLAIHCLARDITLINTDNAIGTGMSKCVTVENFHITADQPHLRQHHHATLTRAQSHDILFQDFVVDTKPRHGLNTEQFSSGIVWSRGSMAGGTFDTHRQLPFENVRTEITLYNDGHFGGTGGPLMGARFVHWNIEVQNHRDHVVGWSNEMPNGIIAGLRGVRVLRESQPSENATRPLPRVSNAMILLEGGTPEPANLYEWQRALRLNRR